MKNGVAAKRQPLVGGVARSQPYSPATGSRNARKSLSGDQLGKRLSWRLTTLFIALTIGEAAASPWNRASGDIFVASRFDYYWSSTAASRYQRFGSDTYAELGLTRRWMLSAKVAYGTSISDSGLGQFSRTGIGDAELGAQRQVQRGEHSATAISLSASWSERLADGARAGFGEHGADAEIRLLHGRDIATEPVKVFAITEVAYRRRFDAAADQVRADALIGIEPLPRLLVLAEARSQLSLGNQDPGGDDFDVIKSRASIVWRATSRWALVAGGEKEFAARGIAPGAAVFVGFWSIF